MTDDTAPTHLNNHHRDTIAAIFRHPAGHNIEWVDVISLLEAIGTVDEGRDNKYTVSLGGETQTFSRHNKTDLDTQNVVDLRRMLTAAGYDSATK